MKKAVIETLHIDYANEKEKEIKHFFFFCFVLFTYLVDQFCKWHTYIEVYHLYIFNVSNILH